MIPDLSQALSWLDTHPHAFQGISRGIERETLRIRPNGFLANTNHPAILGSPLTHKWITTDFAEALLEFITPVDQDINHLLKFLRDIHRYVARQLNNEMMWPMSMPCRICPNSNIQLAQYGSSHIGRMKTKYRQGLKNRYGALIQIIAGIHYNFSLPTSFWCLWNNINKIKNGKETISTGYLHMIRNYYRLGWVIPYLFGASPAIPTYLIKDKNIKLPFESNHPDMLSLPYSTSLRISDIGYTNRTERKLSIKFNSLQSYISSLKTATKTPSEEFMAMGIRDKQGNFLQLNTNILQIENELYIPIRPKCMTKLNEISSDALKNRGIEYVEVRSLDINPFSSIGITSEQIRFLDLFLIWCAMADSPKLDDTELVYTRKNWNSVITEGRKIGQKVNIGHDNKQFLIRKVGIRLLKDLTIIAKVLDNPNSKPLYLEVCKNLKKSFDNPDLTYSARFLNILKEKGLEKTGLDLAEKYHSQFLKEKLEVIEIHKFNEEAKRSSMSQRQLEHDSSESSSLSQSHTN
ncbi:glutamate--cysteine ligase [Candidatus Erwinia haradaeae]|uniref:Glutamate--cysteine ligase n=1 Tax=Candidatus Erwinia haradaeae TaxID=1922217 RepID=A0A803GCP2_9GAMM|nr:glutamate--cysteine ligase [Candidatus Erwinia haradaeae]VFP88394.1 Glutamate--cysteine ligase [Candidatus Erwinia haradaeae]